MTKQDFIEKYIGWVSYTDRKKLKKEMYADLNALIEALQLCDVSERFSSSITEMENEILANLSDLDSGYGRRKWAIAKQTGIPEEILTVLLKRLKLAGKVELIMIWSESTGLPNGSGYCLQGGLSAR